MILPLSCRSPSTRLVSLLARLLILSAIIMIVLLLISVTVLAVVALVIPVALIVVAVFFVVFGLPDWCFKHRRTLPVVNECDRVLFLVHLKLEFSAACGSRT